MKSAGAIKHKLNQVRFRYLKKRIEAELRQVPENCRYNSVLPRPGAGQTVPPAVCLHGASSPETWTASYCDRQVDGGMRARECSAFCAKRTKDEIKEEFRQELERLAIHEVAFHYPDMAALIWVLDADDVSIPEEDPLPTEEGTPSVPDSSPEADPAPQATPVVAEEEQEPPARPPEPPALPAVAKKPWYARLLGA